MAISPHSPIVSHYDNLDELIVVNIWLFFTGVYWSLNLIFLSNYYLQYSTKKNFNKKVIISEIFIKSGISKELESKIIKSIQSSKKNNSQMLSKTDLNKLFLELSFPIKYRLSMSLYKSVIQKSHILRHASPLFIAEILPHLVTENLEENQIVYNYEEIPKKSSLSNNEFSLLYRCRHSRLCELRRYHVP